MGIKSSREASPVWDALIIGGGPAGSATAITLARQGWSVLLLEKRRAAVFKLGESLPPASVGIVRHFLGPLHKLEADGTAMLKTKGNVSCWTSAQPDASDFFFTPNKFGLVVDRACFDRALRRAAVESGVSLQLGTQLLHCRRAPEDPDANWHAEAAVKSDRRSYRVRFLVDCSGRNAVVARELGIGRDRTDKLFAFAQRFVSSSGSDDDRFTRLEAAPQGWWYSNRLPGPARDTTERLVVFHTDRDLPPARAAASSAGFLGLLGNSRHIAGYLKKFSFRPTGRIRGAAAGGERLAELCGPDWLAVGDAALAYDPLSSQGIYQALSCGSTAGQTIHRALQARQNGIFGDHLHGYAREQNRLWSQYKTQHSYFYQCQQRWRDQSFWSRRANDHFGTQPVGHHEYNY